MGNYKISKVLNNNVVIVCDEKDRELIALGGGVGFGKKRGEYISDEDMEKKFIAADSEDLYKKLFNTLTRVSVEYVDIVDYTVEIVKRIWVLSWIHKSMYCLWIIFPLLLKEQKSI